MNSKDRTLAALQDLIASQRAFLEQTNEDIARLRQLKERVLDNPLSVAENLATELNDDAFRLSRSSGPLHSARHFPSLIDRGAFRSRDPTLLKLPDTKTDSKPKQERTPTDLQNYVHQSALNLLSKLDRLSPSPSPPPCPPSINKRPLSPLSATLDPRNIQSISQNANGLRRTSRVHKPKIKEIKDVVTPEEPGPPLKRQKRRLPATRARSHSTHSTRRTHSPVASRASLAPSEATGASSHSLENKQRLTIRIPPLRILTRAELPPPRPLPPPPPPPEEPPKDHNRRKGDVNSETFNQPWSVEEQHLLERLLIEVPRGEKNRWARISKGMEGRRSARQVASRVQKFFDKLDKAGIAHPG